MFVTPAEAFELLQKDAVLVDLRSELSLNGRSFGGCEQIRIRFSDLALESGRIPAGRPVVLADCAGTRSVRAFHMLRELGYSELFVLTGGMVEWERDGLPVTIDRNEELAGGCACRLRPGGRFRRRPGGC